MPPRKEPKEVVVYPASKRKAPPFKPLRPSKLVRSTTSETATPTASAIPAAARPRHVAPTKPTARTKPVESIALNDSDDAHEDDDIESLTAGVMQPEDSDSSEGLNDDPLAGIGRRPPTKKQQTGRRKLDIPRRPSAMLIEDSSDPDNVDEEAAQPSRPPEQAALSDSDVPTIPQPLLIRILHEAFDDKSTQIDKHAIQVLQKYVEIFVRETIERARLEKQDAAERGEIGDIDKNWLELEDLEKVAPAMLLEF